MAKNPAAVSWVDLNGLGFDSEKTSRAGEIVADKSLQMAIP